MGTVRLLTTAELVDVAEQGGDDVDLPPSTYSKNALQIRDSCRHGDLVRHDDFAHHVEFVVSQLGDGCDDAVCVRLTEG